MTLGCDNGTSYQNGLLKNCAKKILENVFLLLSGWVESNWKADFCPLGQNKRAYCIYVKKLGILSLFFCFGRYPQLQKRDAQMYFSKPIHRRERWTKNSPLSWIWKCQKLKRLLSRLRTVPRSRRAIGGTRKLSRKRAIRKQKGRSRCCFKGNGALDVMYGNKASWQRTTTTK